MDHQTNFWRGTSFFGPYNSTFFVALLGTIILLGGCNNNPPPQQPTPAVNSLIPTPSPAPATATDLPKDSSGEYITPFIVGTPNPLPAGPNPGKVTIRWRTNAQADWGEVWVLIPGEREEIKFTEGGIGSQEATWINSGGKYEFRLYAGKAHQQLLATAVVTKSVEKKNK